jgi:hypothetical protein
MFPAPTAMGICRIINKVHTAFNNTDEPSQFLLRYAGWFFGQIIKGSKIYLTTYVKVNLE